MIRNPFYLYFYALAVTVFLGCFQISTAQSIQAERLTTDEGLVHNFVQVMLSDSRGFMWIGTRNGLQRYDGYAVKTYFSDGVVIGIVEDSKGNICFVLGDGSIFQLYLGENGFNLKQLYKSTSGEMQGKIHQVLIDGNDRIWIAYMLGLKTISTLEPDSGMYTFPLFDGHEVYSLLLDKQSRIFVGSSLGFFKAEAEGNSYTLSPRIGPWIIPTYMTRDSKGNIWIAGDDLTEYSEGRTNGKDKNFDEFKLFYFDTALQVHPWHHEYSYNLVKWLLMTPDDRLYLYTKSLVEVDPVTGKPSEIEIMNKEGQHTAFFSFVVCYSRHGILWLGSDNGLIKVDLHKKRVHNTYLNHSGTESIPITIRCLQEVGKDSVLAGSFQKGLFLTTQKNGKPQIMHVQGKKNWDNITNFIYKDKEHGIWVGSQGDLSLYNMQLQRMQKRSLLPAWSFGWDLCTDSSGQYWFLGSFGPLVKMDPQKGFRKLFPLTDRQDQSVRAWKMYPFRHVLMISTLEGFRYFNVKTEKFDTGWALGDELRRKVKGRVWQAQPAGDGRIYITTQWGGLYAADPATGKISRYTFEGNNFYGFETDSQNRLWIITDKGIVCFNPRTSRFRMYNRKDGLITNSFSYHAHAKKANGELLFGGENGFSSFDPELLTSQGTPVETQITSFKVAGIEEADYLYSGQHITLSYNRNFISFDFSSLDFRSAREGRYAYWLEGLDDKWNLSGERNFASYPNLPPGEYTFYVKSASGDGNWSRPVVIRLTIVPPFWQRGWFIILSILIGALLIAGIVFNIIRNFRKEYAYQRTSLQSEIKALRSQINPHFIFNALNAIQHFIIKNEKKEANIFLSKFSSLIRKILDYSAQQTISVEEEIGLLSNYLEIEKLRFEENLQWSIETDPSVDLDTHIPTLLIQPIVENAIVHGLSQKIGGGSLAIYFSTANGYIFCSVKDSGVGRAYHKQLKHNVHHSKGIDLLKQRIEYLNKIYHVEGNIRFIDIVDEAGNAAGTEVIIKLPAL
jgi:ligand-binding sensor domain-containing protein/signal transduction histidine kinase